ncbi:TPA: plasmid replication protein, CyRepA1 family [Pseudomonas aeruginosa]
MQNTKDDASALARFYAERFRSDPWSLIDFFDADIADVAASVGIRWSAIRNEIGLRGDKARPKGKDGVTDKIHRGKVMAWGDTKRADDFDYPFFTFNNNNPAYGHATWSGLAALAELYKREGGTVVSERHQQWLARQEEQRAKREAAQREAEQRRAAAEARIHRERLAYEAAWHCGGRHEFEHEVGGKIRKGFVEVIGEEDGSAPYLQAKRIGAIASRFKMQRMRDSHGEFTAVPLFNISGAFLGLQRLYADKKLQGTGVKMDGAHCILGDLENAVRRYSVEGFATGASVYLAELEAGNEVAVVVTFNVDNLGKVLRLYAKHYPAWRFHNAADNDQWKPQAGNAGVLAGIELHRDLQHPAIVPNFAASPELFGCSAQQIAELRAQNRAPVIGFSGEELAAFKAARKGPTDWNDYHVAFGLEATAKALRARDNVVRAEKDFFDYALQRLSYSGVTAEKAAKSAISAGMLLSPIKYTYKDVRDRVLACIPKAAGVDTFKIRRFAHWLAKQKLEQAHALRSFTPATLAKAHVQHLRLEGIRSDKHDSILLPQHLADLVESLEGMIIVRAPMGSGKTDDLIKPIMQAAPKAAYIAHRVSLLDDAAARLNIQHYQQVSAAWMRDVSHLACCVNSLTHPKFYNTDERSWFTTVDTLCIDEASQVISHTATGPVDGRVRVFDELLDAVASARRVLLCDADANDSVVEFCELARPGQTITIIEVAGKHDHIRIDHTDDETAWQVACDWICAGKKVLVANDSAESAKKLAAFVEDRVKAGEVKPVRMLLVHADSKADPDVEAFLRNPNEEAVKYDALIYSPAISSGVSMKIKHFEHHVGLFSGNTVSPSDAIQMLRRDRSARRYLVGIGHSSAQRPTDPAAIYRGLMQLDEVTFDFEQDGDEVRFVRKKTAFDHLYLTTVTGENKARNDFANNLLLMLAAEGYQVERADLDNPERTQESRSNRKYAGEIVFAKRMDLLTSVEVPDDDTFARLNRQEVRSETESAQVDRYHLAHQLGVDEPTPDDVAFYDDRGIAKVVALELVQADEAQAKAYDQAQRKARVVLTQHRYKTATRAFLVKVFEILGVDRFTGAGEFTSEQCRAVLATITESQAALDAYNALKVGRFIPSLSAKVCATTVVKSMLERFGLTVLKRKTNGAALFSIDADKWSFVMAYVLRRQSLGVHSLTTHESASDYTPKLSPEALEEQPQPAQDAAPSGRDTLHCEGVSTEGKYPLAVTSQLLALASRCYRPSGISLARLVGALEPEVVKDFVTGRHSDMSIKRTLAFAEKLLRAPAR